jgi:hypothetical protein
MGYRVVTIGDLGDASSDAAAATVGTGIDPAKKADFLNLAKTMPDDRAEDLADIVDATPFGHRQKWTRYALGAVAGGVLAVFVLTPLAGAVFAKNLRRR